MPGQKPLRSHFITVTGIAGGILMPRADLIYSFQEAGSSTEIKHRYGKDKQGWNLRQSMAEVRQQIDAARVPDFRKTHSAFATLHTPDGKELALQAEHICAIYKKVEGGLHDTVLYFGLGDVPASEIKIRETPEEAVRLIDEALSPARPGLPRPLDPRY